MDPENFNNKAGSVIMATGKYGQYYTFIPNKLPVELDLNEMVGLVEQATLQLGRLNGMARLLPNPYLFTRLYTKKEALMSSRIEGTQSSLEEILIAAAGEGMEGKSSNAASPINDNSKKGSDLREVINLIKATEEGIHSIKVEEIDVPLLLRLHRMLMDNVRGGERNSGSIRSVPNWIGAPGTKIQEAKYVPPPPEQVKILLDNLISYLRTDDNMPKLVKIAIAHYQFEAIHPFEDGNGRIGRLLLILYMLKVKILDLEMLYLSEYFESHRTQYYDLLFKVSQKGAYEEWVAFFLHGIIEQTGKVIAKATMLLEFSAQAKKKMSTSRSPHLLNTFESLLSNPYITIPSAARKNSISYPAAKRVVYRLIKLGILEKVNSSDIRGQVFVSKQILQILDS